MLNFSKRNLNTKIIEFTIVKNGTKGIYYVELLFRRRLVHIVARSLLTMLMIALVACFLSGCQNQKEQKAMALYELHCARCHLAPNREDLPKEIWENAILPDMAARMGLRENKYDPFAGLSYEEMDAVIKTGIYPFCPTISEGDWQLLKAYILAGAPDSLSTASSKTGSSELEDFFPLQISIDKENRRSYTYLEYIPSLNKVYLGDMAGELMTFDLNSGMKILDRYDSPVVSYNTEHNESYITTIGNIHPSAIPLGKVFKCSATDSVEIASILHRPVHTLVEDLNNDGIEELVISEFGNLTGALSLLIRDQQGNYDKKILLNQPGAIRILAKDMDNDGQKDLIVLTSQGDESITILFQKSALSFEAKKVLRFSPIYGSSWFELLDYDGDGDLDLVTVHGDNADKSYVQKPYHGMRLHLNDGENNFEEVFFYPMDGATRVVASDFDMDGDVDFGLLSTFPDYTTAAYRSFVFLKNTNSEAYEFNAFTTEAATKGKWFLMDSGDIDNDGDTDIILSSFALPFIPAPKELVAEWKEEAIDLMILQNTFNN